ncbi:protein-disulfide reductase DsbD family protein [Alkalimonas collagenimarina]|uniref:Protein-disulfide reductase DsbD family protein n=1 Tax=Alkalimonas collagenimarina TaxID=400390 RepID=A0ABT9GZ89_9GAMM|nr:protein-disulfide reductase DsbD domain-containing protein [Alkalimonas collagenimarina]MDP4536338.1 protein-disulfide reductase DsbD family protein [Alkalimonas collagenimarina]
MYNLFSLWRQPWVLFGLIGSVLFSASALATPPSTGWLTTAEAPHLSVKLTLTGHYDASSAVLPATLQVQLDDDWKTYWQAPGEGGIAPSLHWSDSKNLVDIHWFWPAPSRYLVQGFATQGYQHSVTFPLQLQLTPGAPSAVLQGVLTVPSCTTICVLTDFALELPIDIASLQADEEQMFLFSQAMSQVPQPLADVQIKQAGITDKPGQIYIQLERDHGWTSPEIFIHSNEDGLSEVVYEVASANLSGKELSVVVSASHWLGLPDLTDKTLYVTVTDNEFSAEYPVTLTAVTSVPPDSQRSLLLILLLALAGGLILNIMPCVLPVLGIKLQSMLLNKPKQGSTIRKQFLASALGIITSFWLLALALSLLKWSGESIGWGIQFQNPYFIGGMVGVTWLFTLNLAGAFEVRLPGSLGGWAATKGNNSYAGHFLQGMLATLLATPCTAPFLGTAVAFALSADIVTIVLIFTALGIGMALPWLLLAALPQLSAWLPKPGRWMLWVKPFFAAMMFATSLWLLSLLTPFMGSATFTLLLVALLVVTLFILGRTYGLKIILYLISTLALLGAASGVALMLTAESWQQVLPADHDWQPLSDQHIHTAVAAGNVVFVDITADWCITCKANKIGVLLQQPVHNALAEPGVVRIRGDWTVRNPAISHYLQSNNTFGVPFNKVYGPGAPEGIALPTLLTTDVVIQALEQARDQTK